MTRLRRVVLVLGLALLAACRIEDHTPTGSRRDEDAIVHLLSLYARRVSDRDWPGVRALFWSEGFYSGSMGPGAPRGSRLIVPIDTALGALARGLDGFAAERFDVRVLRTDLRQNGDLAAAWLTTRRLTPVGETQVARDWVEHVLLRRVGGEWRILTVASTPWSRRR